jgi:single-stranded-DNA-specific exonuclease
MLESKARWIVSEADAQASEALRSALGVDPLIARLLVLRGIDTPEAARRFLQGGKDEFHDPYLMDGMDRAVERIRSALERGEKIRIYGDYDADGVSSTTLMVHLFRQLQADFDYYIPHRVREGYGLNTAAVDHAREHGVSLIVTVDTGISAAEEVAYIRELGMDVIVTDHHEPPEVLPDAYAVLNPKKPGCPYPYKQLAGVGVAFKLAHALLGRLPEELLEIATIGTVADLMPLTDENRLIVKLGLERMRMSSYPGIQALLDVAGIERKEVTATHVGFAIGPRINASGRLEAADAAVRLLTADDYDSAERLAYELDALNKERQRIVEEMTKEALAMAAELEERSAIVLAKEGWNVGVIGIVASKVTETFYRPTVILGIDPETGMAKGSARSIAGFDLYKALTHCSELLDHFGGHHGAAGMSMHREHVPAFANKLDALAREWLTEEDFIPMARAEVACSLESVTVPLIEGLHQLAPFGIGNPTPRFLFEDLRMEEQRLIGKEKQHLKLAVRQDGATAGSVVDAVGFGKGRLLPLMSATAKIDALGEVSINEWNGRRKPQIVLQDVRIRHVQVFDWRGSESRLAEKLGGVREAGCRPAVVLLEPEEWGTLPSDLHADLPVWRFDAEEGRLLPLNEEASSGNDASPAYVLLYAMPKRLEALGLLLRSLHRLKRCYVVWRDVRTAAERLVPSRDMFKNVYALVRQQPDKPRGIQELSRRTGLSAQLVEFILRVFEELGFVSASGNAGGETGFVAVAAPQKRELTASELYQRRMLQDEAERFCTYATTKELEAWVIAQSFESENIREEVV